MATLDTLSGLLCSGFEGRLIVGITNLTPRSISLPYADDFLTIEFHRLSAPAEHPYSGPYQGVRNLRPADIAFIAEGEGLALSEVLTTLRSLSENVGVLSKDLTTLKWVIPLIVGVGMAIVGIIVGLK